MTAPGDGRARILSRTRILSPAGRLSLACCAVILSQGGCAGPSPGPDKQFAGLLQGAATGAGAGAVTGFQLGAASGPGAAVGAGIGALAGGVQGAFVDGTEEKVIRSSAAYKAEERRAVVHRVLADHYARRQALHPGRDIYPADVFFDGDGTRLCAGAADLLTEIGRLSARRLPWSRLVVTAYVRSGDPSSPYAARLAEHRAKEVSDALVRAGVEPRRLLSRGMVVPAPLVVDPDDHPDRYSQAIEFAALDRHAAAVPPATASGDGPGGAAPEAVSAAGPDDTSPPATSLGDPT